jgi:hypothetical protein
LALKDSGVSSYTSQIFTDTSHLQEEVEGATEGEQEEFFRQLRELRINPDDVSWAIKKFSAATIEDAIAYTKEQKWANKPRCGFYKGLPGRIETSTRSSNYHSKSCCDKFRNLP